MYSNRQGRAGVGGNGLWLCVPLFVEHDDFAVLDVANIFRADDVERAGLRGQDRIAVEFAQHQRTDAERIARADQLLVGQADKGIGAFERAQAVDEAVDEMVALGLCDQMQDHLGVGGRLTSWRRRGSVHGAASVRW